MMKKIKGKDDKHVKNEIHSYIYSELTPRFYHPWPFKVP